MSTPGNGTDKDLHKVSLEGEQQEVTGAGTPLENLSIKSAGAETAGDRDEIIDMPEVMRGLKVEKDGRPQRELCAPSSPFECYVEIEIVLAAEAWRVGMEGRVTDGLRCDVSRAVDGCSEKVLIQDVDLSSGVVRMILCEGVCGDHKMPLWAAYDLQQQLQDCSSRLRQGATSRMARSVKIVAEVISDDINLEHMDPMDGVAVALEQEKDMREFSSTPLLPVFHVTGQLVFPDAGQGALPAHLPPLVRVAATSSSDSYDVFGSNDALPPLVPAVMLAPSPAHGRTSANI